MAIMDGRLAMATTVATDLGDPGQRSDGSVAPHGPGRQVKLRVTGISAGTVTITTGDLVAAADDLMTVVCPETEITEVHLPSSCKRFIKATFAEGSIDVILDSAQTNS